MKTIQKETDYLNLEISKVSERIKNGELSSVELVSNCLDKIEELNPKLNAFITVNTIQAMKEAEIAEKEIENKKWKGPLHGIPVGIKDFYDTAGIKTTAAFQYFKDRIPIKDADGVTKLKEAGAIIIGKTNMHQLGMGTTGLESYFGAVKNPINTHYIPGGSSSGSAAAVGAGMCYATLDTDAVGSCRLPAACCGVVGFKGTYGLIDSKGILDGEQPPDEIILWLAQLGITTRSVEDTAILLDALVNQNGNKNNNYFLGLNKKREIKIGVANNFKVNNEIKIIFENAIKVISGLGYPINYIAAPFWNFGEGISDIEKDRKEIANKVFRDINILLLPTLQTLVPTVESVTGNPQGLSAELTLFANYYGLPAISVPCGFDKNGLPVSLQIVGSHWSENLVLNLASNYQKIAN